MARGKASPPWETGDSPALPTFTVERFNIDAPDGSYDMYEVKCGRKECGLKFWVLLVWTKPLRSRGRDDDPPARIKTRPCPYCFKVSKLPKRKKS